MRNAERPTKADHLDIRKKQMLAFELSNENQTIQITCDDAGIDAFVSVLLTLKGTGSHVHLRTPVDGSDRAAKLSAVTPWGDPAIAEVIVSHGGE